jgi:glycosyltransferase involved in cell wall biosynthesis
MRILVLSTWFPYPLSQGSKIRAYHLIKGLARQHDLALLSFQDTRLEPGWLDHMRYLCGRVEVTGQDPFAHDRFRKFWGWLSPLPSAVLASHSPAMERQVKRLVAEWHPQCIFALTFVTAPYALIAQDVVRIVDVDNVMTPMLHEEYRRTKKPVKQLRNWLAFRKFRHYENWLYRQFNLCLVTNERDRQIVIDLAHLQTSQVGVVSNGVDISLDHAPSGNHRPNTIIFNGALTYAANYDAMDYFLREIFPLIVAEIPDAQLVITGSTQGVPITRLPIDDHVIFTGYLDDVRPTVSSSCVCVVPLRIGGGTRLKVLEAMALGTPVVSTSKGVEGLNAEAGKHLLVADRPEDFAAQTVRIMRDPVLKSALTAQASQLVKEQYDWDNVGQHLCNLVENV